MLYLCTSSQVLSRCGPAVSDVCLYVSHVRRMFSSKWLHMGWRGRVKKEGGYKDGYLACGSGVHVSLLVPFALFLRSSF